MDVKGIVELSQEEEDKLAGILNYKGSDLSKALEPFASAAIEEYLRMFLGQKVFTRGSDFREYRLYLLIKHVFNDFIPGEQTVSDLFSTTASQSRSLIRSVMSKYQYELVTTTDKSFKKAITEAKYSKQDDCYLITTGSENIISELNLTIAAIDGTLPPITKRPNTVSTYRLPISSREKLAKLFEIELPKEAK